MCRPNLQFVALPVPEIITIAVLGLGFEEARGVSDGTVRKSVGDLTEFL